MSPQLFFEEGTYKGTTVRFKNFIIIGTGDSANLKLEDPSLSPVHTAIVKGNDGYYALSLGENNLVSINGNSVQSARLNSGDSIGLSENCLLRFTLDEMESAEYPDIKPNIVLKKNKVNNRINSNFNVQANSHNEVVENKKVSTFAKILGVTGWLIMILLLLGTSFLAGIYTTDKILGF